MTLQPEFLPPRHSSSLALPAGGESQHEIHTSNLSSSTSSDATVSNESANSPIGEIMRTYRANRTIENFKRDRFDRKTVSFMFLRTRSDTRQSSCGRFGRGGANTARNSKM